MKEKEGRSVNYFEIGILACLIGFAIFSISVMAGSIICSPCRLIKMRVEMFKQDIRDIVNATQKER